MSLLYFFQKNSNMAFERTYLTNSMRWRRLRGFTHIMSISILLIVLMGSCGTSGKVSNSRTSHSKHPTISSRTQHFELPADLAVWQRKVCKEALTWLGTPYQYAGNEKGVGTDCSGLVMSVYENTQGWKLPRNSAKQAEFCQPIDERDLLAGDLVFFATGSDKSKVSHVGIMLDSNSFVHASASKGVVISTMQSSYYQRNFYMFGRLPQIVGMN